MYMYKGHLIRSELPVLMIEETAGRMGNAAEQTVYPSGFPYMASYVNTVIPSNSNYEVILYYY